MCIYTIYVFRLPHLRSGDSKGQEMFFADKQTRNFSTLFELKI